MKYYEFCENCHHWKQYLDEPGEPKYGTCRKIAKAVVFFFGDDRMNIVSTKSKFGCMEFSYHKDFGGNYES